MTGLGAALFTASLVGVLGASVTVLHRVTNTPDFMLVSLLPIGAYVGFWLDFHQEVSPLIGALPAFLLGGSIGASFYRLVLRPLIEKQMNPVLIVIASIGGQITLTSSLSIVVYFLRGSYLFYTMNFNYFDPGVPNLPTTMFIGGSLLLFLWLLIYEKTVWRKLWIARNENSTLFQVQGVNISQLDTLIFFLIYGIVALSGLILPYSQNASPSIWVNYSTLSLLGGLFGHLKYPARSFFGGFTTVFLVETIFQYLNESNPMYLGYKWALYPVIIWIIMWKIK